MYHKYKMYENMNVKELLDNFKKVHTAFKLYSKT